MTQQNQQQPTQPANVNPPQRPTPSSLRTVTETFSLKEKPSSNSSNT